MEINMFAAPIIHKKKKYDFSAWLEKRRLIKLIKRTSPSFRMMCDIHEFLEILRECYMYTNDENFHLFLATTPNGYVSKNTKAMIYKENNFSITFVLHISYDSLESGPINTINIEISRNSQNRKAEKETISFIDGQYTFKDIYDQEKILFITSCLMTGVSELVEYFYKNKKI